MKVMSSVMNIGTIDSIDQHSGQTFRSKLISVEQQSPKLSQAVNLPLPELMRQSISPQYSNRTQN